MKYILVEDSTSADCRFNIFAVKNDTKYVFSNLFWSATIQELLFSIKHARLHQSDFHDSWLDRIVLSFDELPTLSYIEQHYPELLI